VRSHHLISRDTASERGADSGLSEADAKRALDAFVNATTKALKRGDTVSLTGFGSFSISKQSARTGRNPRPERRSRSRRRAWWSSRPERNTPKQSTEGLSASLRVGVDAVLENDAGAPTGTSLYPEAGDRPDPADACRDTAQGG
jgi:nucleoid DNA-binding protein